MANRAIVLKPQEAYGPCDLTHLGIESTLDLKACEECIGQTRALSAINLGLGIDNPGYNIYLSGPPGVGKTSTIKKILAEVSKTKPTPLDWCYVYNFIEPNIPKAISLPTGMGRVFKKDMEDLVETLTREIPRAFESKEYEQEQQKIYNEAQREKAEVFEGLQRKAMEAQIQLQFTPTGVVSIPLYHGKPLTQEEYARLTDEEKENIRRRKEEIEDAVATAFKEAKRIDKEASDKVKELEKRVALFAVSDILENIREKYKEHPQVIDYLHHVQKHILENIYNFRTEKEHPPHGVFGFMPAVQAPTFREYQVNVFIDNSKTEGAPVVFESHPIYSNLFGTIEREARFGVYVTDFTLIRPGSLAKANGGYLVVDALDVLRAPFVWDSLKKVLENQELTIEDVFQQWGFTSALGLRPEPVKVNIKVIMIGTPFIYQLLYTYDDDFRKLFKVKADFDSVVDRTPEMEEKYACFIKFMIEREGLKPFARSGLEAVVEHSSRIAGDQKKLSVQHGIILKLLLEANYIASLDGDSRFVERVHVERAIDEKNYRSNMIEEKIQELIKEGTILIEATGKAVGQVNGLAVYDIGDYTFGKPSRITCETYMGMEGVVNIERKARLSGSIHDKGVLILGGYLGAKYARQKPLSLSATLAFEQSYSLVEGDSASAAELIALLSSISGVPIRQDIAITGSIDQKGNIQPIGGVNEKIEGFYLSCKLKGLTGQQGVVIPKRNVKNLMLSREVVAALREGRFHIYPVENIDEVIEIMMDIEAGVRKEDGTYPEGTLHYLVDKRLGELTEELRKLSKSLAGDTKPEMDTGEEEMD